MKKITKAAFSFGHLSFETIGLTSKKLMLAYTENIFR